MQQAIENFANKLAPIEAMAEFVETSRQMFGPKSMTSSVDKGFRA